MRIRCECGTSRFDLPFGVSGKLEQKDGGLAESAWPHGWRGGLLEPGWRLQRRRLGGTPSGGSTGGACQGRPGASGAAADLGSPQRRAASQALGTRRRRALASSGGSTSSVGSGGSGNAPLGGAAAGSGKPRPRSEPRRLGFGGVPSNAGGSAGDALAELIASIDAYWDFETVEGSTVPSSVGDAVLELFAATVAPGPTGAQLTLSDGATGAQASGSIVDTGGSFSIASWIQLDELDEYNTFLSIDAPS